MQTGQLDSKFGFGIADGQAQRRRGGRASGRHLRLAGFHAHIGSQIFELELRPRDRGDRRVRRAAAARGPRTSAAGSGSPTTDDDEPPAIDEYVGVKVDAVRRLFGDGPRILLEPGRSLVGNAGVTLYTVGTVKEIPGVRTYVAVDGGMSDNLRPMLYGSRYEALIADRAADAAERLVTIAGKHCESGDVLVARRAARRAAPGRRAGHARDRRLRLAMAYNYNGVPRPPVIFCTGGDARLVVRRETYEDLTARDVTGG